MAAREKALGAAELAASNKARLLRFLRAHVCEVVRSEDLTRELGDPEEWRPALAALRRTDGYRLQGSEDGKGLGPDEYLLESLERRPILARGLSGEARRLAISATDLSCRYCGVSASDGDPCSPQRPVRLRVSLLIPEEQGGPVVPENLQASCLSCLDGRRRARLPPPPDLRSLLTTVRRADPVDQIALLDWLGSRYGRLVNRMLREFPADSDGQAKGRGRVPAPRRRMKP
ncbi:MAG: hypothetical protein DIJKHBIC_02653 [Thermoanaerobaculia bacterium]|nr:hypothetical protein [Thermoanaerobaculia bacterium]